LADTQFENRSAERQRRLAELRITLSDWVFNAVAAREVLTLSRDYFHLRKPRWSGGLMSLRANIAGNRTKR
jgi:hypothetical protein